jgi:hypothetical protein
MPLVLELERIRQEIEFINAQAIAFCEGLRETELSWRPEPGRWSLAEILVHLRVTTQAFLPSVDRAVEDARRQNLVGEGPFLLGLMGKFYVWYVEPPPVIRLPAPKQLRPLLGGPPSDALPGFLQSQQWMVARLESANGLDLARVRVRYPLAKFIRMNLLAFFSVFTGHERRHLWQASNLRRQMSEKNQHNSLIPGS